MNRSDLVFSVVGVVVLCLLVFGYGATASQGPVVTEQVVTVTSTWVSTDRTLHEPLHSVVLWLLLAFFGFCAIGLAVLVGKGVWKGWKWWVHRASPTVDRIVTIQVHVTNDSDSSQKSAERFREIATYLVKKRHWLLWKLLTWLNGGPPREVRLMSVSETLDSS